MEPLGVHEAVSKAYVEVTEMSWLSMLTHWQVDLKWDGVAAVLEVWRTVERELVYSWSRQLFDFGRY